MRVAVHQASIEYSRAFTSWRTLLHVERLALLLRLDLLLGCASCLAWFCSSAAWARLETTTVRECALRCNCVVQSKSLRDARDRHNAAGMKHTMDARGCLRKWARNTNPFRVSAVSAGSGGRATRRYAKGSSSSSDNGPNGSHAHPLQHAQLSRIHQNLVTISTIPEGAEPVKLVCKGASHRDICFGGSRRRRPPAGAVISRWRQRACHQLATSDGGWSSAFEQTAECGRLCTAVDQMRRWIEHGPPIRGACWGFQSDPRLVCPHHRHVAIPAARHRANETRRDVHLTHGRLLRIEVPVTVHWVTGH